MVTRWIPGFMASAMVICTPLKAADVIAHRGASKDAPENTLAAFRLAWEQDADAIELDVHLSADGRIVVIHDATTRRTTGVDLKVAETSFMDLRALDAGLWKGERWRGERIPSLEEVLAAMPDGKRIFIEVKCGAEILPELSRVLKASAILPAWITIIGFNHEVVKAAKARLPEIEVCWITRPRKDGGNDPSVDELLAKARLANLDGLDLDHTFAIDAAFVAKCRAAGMKLYVWTVDKPADAKRLRSAGVDGITTNVPARIRARAAVGFRFAPVDGTFMKRGVTGVLDLFRTQPDWRKAPAADADADGPFLTAD